MKKTDRLWWKKATAWMLTAAVACSLPGTPVFGSPETGGLFRETENSEWQDEEIEKATDSNAQEADADSGSAGESAESREEQTEGDEIAKDEASEETVVSKATDSDAQEKEADEDVNTEADAETKTIVSWTWKEKAGEETLIDGKLLLTNGTEESQPSFDDIVSMLPEKIRADVEWESASGAKTQAESGDEDTDEEIFLEGTLEDTQIITLDGWNCDEYEQDADGLWPMTGTFLFEAELPEGYELADEAEKLSVEVVMEEPGIAVMDETEPIVRTYDGLYNGDRVNLFQYIEYKGITWPDTNGKLKVSVKMGKTGAYETMYGGNPKKVKDVRDNDTEYYLKIEYEGEQKEFGPYQSKIQPYNLSDTRTISVSILTPACTYDGTGHTPKVKVSAGKVTFVENSDYTLNWYNNNNHYDLPLKDALGYLPDISPAKGGTGNLVNKYSSNTPTWTIDKKPVSLNIKDNEKTYDGNNSVPETFGVSLNSNSILPGDDSVYLEKKTGETAKYKSADAGSGIIIAGGYELTGDGSENYKLPTITGTINPAEITNISVKQTGTLTYNGEPQQSQVTASATTVTPKDDTTANPPTFYYSANSTAETSTYTTEVPKFTDAGDHTVYYVVRAKNHKESDVGTFQVHIGQADLSTADVTAELDPSPLVYNGEAQQPNLTVKLNGNKIDPENYTIQYINEKGEIVTEPINAGTYKIQITGQGSCTGTKVLTETFTIGKGKMPELKDMNIAIGYRTTGKLEYPIEELSAYRGEDFDIDYNITEDSDKLFDISDVNVDCPKGDTPVLVLNMKGYTKDQIDHKVTVSLSQIETANYKEGSMKIIITITDRGTQTKVPTAAMTFTQNSDGETFTAEIAKVTGAEYSFDGTTWSAENRKTDCLPDTAYTGYIRFAETDEFNPGPAASVTKRTGKISAQMPVANPAGKTFQGSLSVTLTTATKNAKIFYTLDGTTPTESSSLYTGPITISDSVTLKAIAVKTNLETSPVLTEVYTKQASNNTNNSGGSASGGGSSSDSGTSSSGIRVDARKGRVSSTLGIITGENNKRGGDGYSHWIQDERGWWLCYSDGSYPQGSSNPEQQVNANTGAAPYQWELVNGRWFAFDPDGYMATGWIMNQGTWYYLEPDGAMKTGWVKVGDTWYYLNADGSMRTDGIYLDGVYYRFDPETGAWIAG